MRSGLKRLAWTAWEAMARTAGRSYIAGDGLDDALRVCAQLGRLGFGTTTCYWDAHGETPDQIAAAYLAALAAPARRALDCYLSFKVPPLRYDLALLDQVIAQAARSGTLVHFDAHGIEDADPTFAAIAHAARTHDRLGCTLPARWARSVADVDFACAHQLHVRVVKGQWPDPAAPDADQRAGYLAVIDRLAGRARFVAVATHDHELARAALQRLRAAGTPCAMELLYGLPLKPVLRVARSIGVPVRIYVPYGYGWLPYSLGHLRRNPRVLWWIVRDQLSGGSPLQGRRLTSDLQPIRWPVAGTTLDA